MCATFIGGTGFFFGPIIGATFFSLSSMALTRTTEIWSLYQGILLMIFVLYFPRGLAGFFIDQNYLIKSKSCVGLIHHYFKIIVPIIITTISIAWLTECFNIILNHQDRSEFTFLWTLFSISNPINWGVSILLTVIGIYLLVTTLKCIEGDSV